MSISFYERIHQKALNSAQDFRRAEAALIEVLQEVDKHRVYTRYRQTSLHSYCIQVLGLSPDVACNAITVARKAQVVPQLKAEIEAGNLSISKARKIASVITAENQAIWIERAETLTSRELEKEVAKANPQAAIPERAKYVTDNRLSVSFGVSEELMQKIRRIQDLVSQKERRSVSLEEAIEKMVDLYLERNDPVIKAERAHARGNLKEAVAVPARKSASDLPVPGRVPIPASIRLQVDLRDQRQCVARDDKGRRCMDRRFIHYHHKIPVELGGPHSVENILTLCSGHHRIEHHPPETPRSGISPFVQAK